MASGRGLIVNAIVVGADGSEHSLRAVKWAAEEAGIRRGPLTIVHAAAPWLYDTPVDPRLGAVRQWLLTNGEEVVEEAVAAARARDGSIVVEGKAVPGGAAKALLEEARNAAMVVLGGHGTGTVAGLLLGSTALQVVAHTPVPAVVVRHLEPGPRREIVVGADLAAAGEPALAFAFEEASLREARLRVVHAWSDPGSAGPGDMIPLVYDPQIVAGERARWLGDALAPWREKFPDVEVTTDIVRGRPVRMLSGASAQAGLLVVGTRGRGGFSGLLLGSVSHGMLHHAHCPLVVVPSGPRPAAAG